MENKIIAFPKGEWDDVKERLKAGKVVYTIRVDNEYGKYKIGDVLNTEWEQEVKIISVKKINGGIEELKTSYDFFKELTEEMIRDLEQYSKMEIISLVAISRSLKSSMGKVG